MRLGAGMQRVLVLGDEEFLGPFTDQNDYTRWRICLWY